MTRALVLCALSLAACVSDRGRTSPPTDGGARDALPVDLRNPSFDLGPQAGCQGQAQGCYTVYAHADHVLYRIDLAAKSLVEIGPFHAPNVMGAEDVITDLAVAPDDTIYGVSATNLYRVSASDGHVTDLGAITKCGMFGVALTFLPDGNLYTADFGGAFCRIDPTTTPPQVIPLGALGSGDAVSGDLVAVADGTLYATAYALADSATQDNNFLVKLDPSNGHVIQKIGSTGYSRLFGAAFALGKVFGFTHDGSGDVVTIDPTTGKGTLYKKFTDSSGSPIAFAGAAVNSMVAPTIF